MLVKSIKNTLSTIVVMYTLYLNSHGLV